MRIIILVITGSVLFLSLLGLRGLCEPDEGRYAEISREMVESGDWLTPRLNYIKHFHKPPLVYWMTAAGFTLFGMNEFTARLPAAILGILGLVITYRLSIQMGRDKDAGLFSGIVLATTLQYFGWTQVLSSDMVFGFFILLAFYGFWARSYLFYIGMAFAFMTKGPVGVIIPALVILFTRGKVFNVLKGIILFLLIVSPWFIYVCSKNPGLLRYFLFYQSLNRLFTDVHGRGGNIFYFIPVLLIGGLPWIIFMPWAFKIKDKANLFLAMWIVIPVIFFSLSGSKLPGYILPIYPAISIFTGNYFKQKKVFFILCITVSFAYLLGAGIIAKNEEKLGENLSIRKAAGIIKRYGSPEDKVINFRCFLQGLPFYLKKRVVLANRRRETQFEEDMSGHEEYLIPEIEEFKVEGRFWTFTKLKDYPDLLKGSADSLYEIWRSAEYILVSNYEI